MEFKNVEMEELKLPMTLPLSTNQADKIIQQLESAGMKFMAKADENKINITFNCEDFEKMNRLLQPYHINQQLDEFPKLFPKTEKKENLVPFINTVANLYERKLNNNASKMSSHKEHIKTLETALENAKNSVEKLNSRNDMLKGIAKTFPVFQNPINALIKRNENKVERLIKKNIPKLKKQIQVHNNTLDKLEKRAESLTVRNNICHNLSGVIRSFGILNKEERNKNYLTSMSALNINMQTLNNEKINNCIDRLAVMKEQYNTLSAPDKIKAQDEFNKINSRKTTLEAKNKVLQTAQLDYSDMLSNIKRQDINKSVDKAEQIFDNITEKGFTLNNAVDNLSVTTAYTICDKAAQVKMELLDKILDKDGDLIPDRLDSTFNPLVYRNAEEMDKDGDGIPDRFDSTFNPKENQQNQNVIKLVTDDELKNLVSNNFNLKVNKKKRSEDGKIPIMFSKSQEEEFNKIMSGFTKKTVAMKK